MKTIGVSVTQDELRRRTIRREDYVSCEEAFIDCRTSGSEGKKNYSIIGVGVSESSRQVVNLVEPHGFCLGAAEMPSGVTNSLHLHFTAEVFLNLGGKWNIRWGRDEIDGELLFTEGSVISVPTWIFRGFTNVGAEEARLFTVLGFDNNGGIVWSPSVLEAAAQHGLYLGRDNQLIDVGRDGRPPSTSELIEPMDPKEIANLRHWSAEEMQQRCARPVDLQWSTRPFLCSELPGGRAELAQVIGYGMTQDRHQAPLIGNPHSFNLAWLRADSGEGMLTHRHDQTQVLLVYSGRWRVVFNEGSEEVKVELCPSDTLSVPSGAWRSFQVVSSEAGQLAVVNGGDGRVALEWSDRVERLARGQGTGMDAAGYVGPLSVIGTSSPDD